METNYLINKKEGDCFDGSHIDDEKLSIITTKFQFNRVYLTKFIMKRKLNKLDMYIDNFNNVHTDLVRS